MMFLVLMVFSSGAEVASATPTWCEVLVASENSTRPGTDDSADFIGYLGQLLESQVIGTEELTRFQDSLERGTLVNPISEQDAQLHSRLLIHYEGLQERIERSEVDPARVLIWVLEQLGERSRVRARRDETREQSRDPHQKMIFHRIEPGTFKMGENGKFVEVKITKPFDLMSTQVTQRQWSLVMGENPSQFKDGVDSVEVIINGSVVTMQPNHPVEQVSWNMVYKFIKKINELSVENDHLLYSLIPDHRAGDQYRLPTEAEWEFVVRNRASANGVYSFGGREEDLGGHGWFNDNSDRSTHPVASLKPLWVDGRAFYDLHGNVWEWVQDWSANLRYGERLVDPTGPEEGFSRVLRGGSSFSSAQDCRSGRRHQQLPSVRFFYAGFRLARIGHE